MQNKENETNKIKNVMLNSFQHPLHFLHTSKEQILNQVQDDNMMRTAKAFTLIELLVVVLIIGILAAVAVPQYQKAVMKSRYATLKNLTRALVTAEEVYYLASSKYTQKIQELDIDMPSGKLENSTNDKYYYPWGNCQLVANTNTTYVTCYNSSIKMSYQEHTVYVNSASDKRKRYCIFAGTDTTTPQAQICKQETNASTYEGTSYRAWVYR